MFTKYDLDTIIIKVLMDNSNKWFSKSDLYNEVKKLFSDKKLFISHYLFVWEKLLLNTNFIDIKMIGNNDIIKIKTFESNIQQNLHP